MGRMYKWVMFLILLVIVVSGGMAVLTIWSGGKGLAVPPLKEMSVVEAVDEAQRLGLKLKIEQIESTLPGGTVLSQWPEPGAKIKKDATVILKVSKGGNRIALPDVRGLEYSQALKKLEESGFQAGDTLRVSDDTRAAGVVIAQSPSAPVMLESTRKIDLLVSQGQVSQNGLIQVPEVLQREEQIARKLVEESGLVVANVEYVYTQNSPEGMVISIRPKVGTSLKRGQGVVLQVASLKKPPSQEKAEVSQAGTVLASTVSGTAEKVSGQTEATSKSQLPSGGTLIPVKPPSSKPSTATAPVTKPSTQLAATPKSAPVPAGSKVAKIRYQVPPLTKQMPLKIEIVDGSGTRVLLNREVKGGEYVSLEAPYIEEGVVTIFLGGEFVWQDRYR
ncbi:MAG: PASTA domain-containing protein [Aminobacterium colombiense]|jgi:beta-lactam-binding protein with PASTA domain|nr:PASTA domain-containing protein [Aminobacterium colombiense]